MKSPIPTKSGGSSDRTPMPKTASCGANGLKKVPGGSEVRSNGPKGGKPPTNGTTAPLPRRS